MVKVYLLKSLKDNTYYVGMTTDLDQRLKDHNRGKTKYTKGHIPYELIYHEDFRDFSSARKREKYFKSNAGKKYLKKEGIIK